jgi:hypothetical protein
LPGRTPREAVNAFVEPLKDIVSCVARAKINLSHGGWGVVGKIAEYDVAAMRDDWEPILAFRENDFQIYRTWS